MTLPLSPYTVIDLTRARSGPTCVRQLADMGASDADQVKLHFEIRRFGKPIDPLKLLPGERPV